MGSSLDKICQKGIHKNKILKANCAWDSTMSTSGAIKNSQCCRICLQKAEISKNIFTVYFETLDYAKLIFECSGVEITENQSADVHICTECEKSLLDAYSFKRKIIESNNILKGAETVTETESKIKEEDEFADDFEEGGNDYYSDYEQEEPEVKGEEETNDTPDDEPEEPIKKLRNCRKCKLQFDDQKQYAAHFRKFHSSKREEIVCPICGKTLSSLSLTNHLKIHETETKLVCQICNKSLKNQSILNKHMRTHTKEKRYKCEHCDERFIHTSSRRMHTDQVHLGIKRYSCKLCPAKYFDNSALRSHVSYNHSGDKKHKCEICNNFFINVTVLKYHMRTHMPEKQFSCDTCGKCFSNHSGLTRHLRRHTKTKDYPCSECKKEYAQLSCLTNHMKSHIVHVLPVETKLGEQSEKVEVLNS